MTRPEKYNFKISINQFHQNVSSNFEDNSESILIDLFESTALSLRHKPHSSMIELGSNQCFYSLLFKHILGKDKTTNIMVEPHEPHLLAGKQEFANNNCDGVFYHRGIGSKWVAYAGHNLEKFVVPPITLEEIFKENNIDQMDVLHCDIDGAEHTLLTTDEKIFEQNKIKHVFLLTHGPTNHNSCKQLFEKYKYSLVLEISEPTIGGDSLLVYSSLI